MKYRLQTITTQEFDDKEKLEHYLRTLAASENLPEKVYQKIKKDKFCQSSVMLGGVRTTTRMEIQELPTSEEYLKEINDDRENHLGDFVD